MFSTHEEIFRWLFFNPGGLMLGLFVAAFVTIAVITAIGRRTEKRKRL
jgi:hypothetical protein